MSTDLLSRRLDEVNRLIEASSVSSSWSDGGELFLMVLDPRGDFTVASLDMRPTTNPMSFSKDLDKFSRSLKDAIRKYGPDKLVLQTAR